MSSQALLHFKNIKKSFSGNVVLDGVNFEIYPGQVVALAGENGCGKIHSDEYSLWNERDSRHRRI